VCDSRTVVEDWSLQSTKTEGAPESPKASRWYALIGQVTWNMDEVKHLQFTMIFTVFVVLSAHLDGRWSATLPIHRCRWSLKCTAEAKRENIALL
jgi:hypothetical protein